VESDSNDKTEAQILSADRKKAEDTKGFNDPSIATESVDSPSHKSKKKSKKSKKSKKPRLTDEQALAAVQPKVFSAKLKKKKVKVTVDGLGVHIVEDSDEGVQIGSYEFTKLVSWGAAGRKKDEFHLSPSKEDTLVFSTKEAPQLEMAVQSAAMTLMAASALVTEQGTEQDTGVQQPRKGAEPAVAAQTDAGTTQGHAVDVTSDDANEDFASDDEIEQETVGSQVQADFSSGDDDDEPAD